MKRQFVTLPHLVIDDKVGILLQKLTHSLIRPRPERGKDRVTIYVCVLNNYVRPNRYEILICVKFLHYMFLPVIRVQNDHPRPPRQTLFDPSRQFRIRGTALEQSNTWISQLLRFLTEHNIDPDHHTALWRTHRSSIEPK